MDEVIITGTAYNAKAGAVISSEGRLYFVDGLNYWDDELVETTISVSGNIKIEENTKENAKNKDGEWQQSSISTKYIITEPKWEIIQQE